MTLIASLALLALTVAGCKNEGDTVSKAPPPSQTPAMFAPKGVAKGSGFASAVGGAPEGSTWKKGPPTVGGKLGG